MAFSLNRTQNGYSEALATSALAGDPLYLAALVLDTQYEYKDNQRTDNITGYQVFVATPTQAPFKIKFEVDNQPNLEGFAIGDKVSFKGLQAIQIRNNVYFKASGISKG